MDTATRLLELLALLAARPVWTGDALAVQLGVTPRTVRRDIARLRSLEYPVESVTGPAGGYRLGRGDDLPPLVLDDQEALAVVLGLQTAPVTAMAGLEDAAVSAMAKLERVLPERLGNRVRDVSEATMIVDSGQEVPVDPDQLLVLAQACRRGERVRFMYTARDDRRSLRLADPYRLVHAARRWYLVAWDRDRHAWRTFRVDRLHSVVTTGDEATLPEEPDAQALVRAALGFNPWPVRARVRLHLPHGQLTRMVSANWGQLTLETETTTIWTTGGSHPAQVARWLASFPCQVEVLEPEEVRTALADHLRVLVGDDQP